MCGCYLSGAVFVAEAYAQSLCRGRAFLFCSVTLAMKLVTEGWVRIQLGGSQIDRRGKPLHKNTRTPGTTREYAHFSSVTVAAIRGRYDGRCWDGCPVLFACLVLRKPIHVSSRGPSLPPPERQPNCRLRSCNVVNAIAGRCLLPQSQNFLERYDGGTESAKSLNLFLIWWSRQGKHAFFISPPCERSGGWARPSQQAPKLIMQRMGAPAAGI